MFHVYLLFSISHVQDKYCKVWEKSKINKCIRKTNRLNLTMLFIPKNSSIESLGIPKDLYTFKRKLNPLKFIGSICFYLNLC